MQKCLPVEMIWSFGGHLNLFAITVTFSRRKCWMMYWRSESQTIPSIFVSADSDIFNNQTHPAYSPAMSVFHYGMFEVKLMNNICIAVFCQPATGKGWLFSFIVSIHRFWLVLQSALRGVIRQLYNHCFCLFGSFHPFYWNHHFDIQSDGICTLLTKRIACTFKWSYGILDTGQMSWMLDSVHDTCESKTWVPNICPKIHPACGPLQNMQAFSTLGNCVSVIPIMPPSPLSTAFSCSCTWSWLRASSTFAFLWINMQMDILQTSTRGVTMHVQVPPALSSLPTTNHYIFIFAIRNEAYLGLAIY